ncbi:MAG: PDZ domain-containing protein [Planctomycetes bacterium]|nr:PDZ domain-containing protein [Planctomycetota bacterium]
MQKIISTIILSLFFVTLFLAPARSQESSNISNTKVLAQFNIEKDAKAILLPVEFNGKEYLFELDTGSSHTLFDISLKDKLGKPNKIVKGKTPAGLMKFTLYNAPEAFLGPLNIKDCRTVTVLNLEQASSALGRKIHGIIGMNFLKKYVVRIDFDKGMVSFLKSTNEGIFSFLRRQKNEHPDWGQEIPIKYKHIPSVPYIKGNVDGNKVDFLIDTGLKHHIHNSPVNHLRGWLESKTFKKVASKIQFENKLNMLITARGKAPSDFINSTMVGRFSIGSLEYKDVFFDQSDNSSLGMPFLSRHLITFDFPNQKMYLKQGKYFSTAGTAYVLLKDAGFSLRRKSENIFVSSVDSSSPPFKKQIKENDIILKVNNQNVTSYGLIEFVEFLSLLARQENENITLTIKRGYEIKQESFDKTLFGLKTMELIDSHYHLIFK